MGACRAAHGGNSPLRAVLSTVDAGPRLRRSGPLHRRPLSRLRVPLPASASARRASGGVLSRPLPASSGAVASRAVQGVGGSPPGRAVRARERTGLPGLRRRAACPGSGQAAISMSGAVRALRWPSRRHSAGGLRESRWCPGRRADRLVPAPGKAALVLVESIGAPSHTLAKLTESRPVYGVLKLGLEVLLPLARLARRGEAIRVGAVRNRPT